MCWRRTRSSLCTFSECARSRCAGVSAGPHSPIQMCPGAGCSACLLLRIFLDPLAGHLVKHISTYSGCLGRTKCVCGGKGGGSFQRFFFSISSCVNVSLLCSCTLRQSQPLEQFSAYKKTCFDSLFRFRTCEFKLDGIRPYPWTSCPASASPRLPLV